MGGRPFTAPPYMAKKVSLETLLGEVRARHLSETGSVKASSFGFERGSVEGSNYTNVTGFYLYAEFRVGLRISGAETDENATRLLELIQLYNTVAESCGRVADVEHLEVQGERTHFLLRCDMINDESFARMLTFSVALANIVERRVRPLAGDDWQGFAVAAGHGRTILVSSRPFDPSDSLISLGPAANVPDKKLNQEVTDGGVASGHLAANLVCYGQPSDPEAAPEWHSFNLMASPDYLRKRASDLSERMLEATQNDMALFGTTLLAERRQKRVVMAKPAEFLDVSDTHVKDPRKVQGHAARIDLDGFSAQVKAAFRAGTDRAIEDLVERFNVILTYPRQFVDQLDRPATMMPWAGDQTNLILLPKPEETYDLTRGYLPTEAARRWHSQNFHDTPTKAAFGSVYGRARWVETLGGATWVVGWAGGDDDGDGDGHSFLLVANIYAGGRRFLVASGWGWRRALDAQEAD